MWTMSSPKGVQNNHMATPVKVARQQTTPELSGTFRTLPPEPKHAPELSGTFRNLSPQLASATCLRNLHQPAPELSGTFLGTCSCDPHQHTPELIWAEDPIGLRCWGKNTLFDLHRSSFPIVAWRCLTTEILPWWLCECLPDYHWESSATGVRTELDLS